LSGHDLPVIEINSFNDVKEAYAYLKNDTEHSTVCIDSLSELSETLLAEFKNETKDPRQAYGRMADEMSLIVRLFRDLPNKNVYMIAKQARLVDEISGKITYAPLIPGKSFTNNLPYFFDIVCCMRVNKDNKRYLQTQPTTQYEAKDRSGKLAEIEEPNLTKLFTKVLQA
jgi:hypothetical protein